MFFDNKYIILKDVLYVPQMNRNFIYISCILEQKYIIFFKVNKVFIFNQGIKICSIILENNLYKLRPTREKFVLSTEMFRTAETQYKRLKISSSANLWYLRLGHINLNNYLLSQLEDNYLPPCESCLEGKMTKRSLENVS